MREDILFCVSGPSGVGKGTLVKALMKDDPTLSLSVSCTTRRPREGEKEGVHYFFLTREEFQKGIQEDAFIEYDEHFGNFYGTPRRYVEEQLKAHRCVILEIDVVGALQVKRQAKPGENIVTILIVPPAMEVLEERLEGRGSESEEQLRLRQSRVEYELAQGKYYDYIVVNDDFQSALCELKKIIQSEKNKE